MASMFKIKKKETNSVIEIIVMRDGRKVASAIFSKPSEKFINTWER